VPPSGSDLVVEFDALAIVLDDADLAAGHVDQSIRRHERQRNAGPSHPSHMLLACQ
jgi:hypothetical protein